MLAPRPRSLPKRALPGLAALWLAACAPASTALPPASPGSPPASPEAAEGALPARPATPPATSTSGWDAPGPPGLKQATEGLPRVLPYQQGRPMIPGYHLENRPRLPLLITGLGLFGVFYTLTAINGDPLSFIPVAGPIAILGRMQVSPNDPFVGLAYVAGVVLVFDALAQGAGIGLAIAGVANPKQVQVRDPPARANNGSFLRIDARGPALVF